MLTAISSQFFSLSPSEIGLLLELLDTRMAEISLTHSPNMNAANEDDKGTKRVLSVSRTTGADGLPGVIFKFAGEFQAAAALNAGEARTLRVLQAGQLNQEPSSLTAAN